MPWWTNRAEGLGVLSAADASYSITSCTCCERRSIPRSHRYDRVGFDAPSILIAPLFELFDITLRVIPFALLDGGSKPVWFVAARKPTLFLKHCVDIDNSLDAFGVVPRLVFFKDFAVVQKHTRGHVITEKMVYLHLYDCSEMVIPPHPLAP